MRVNQIQLDKLQKIYQQRSARDQENARDIQHDKMDISNQSRLLKEIQAGLEETSENRKEKIESLKSQIATGRYQVDSQDIAKKILDDLE